MQQILTFPESLRGNVNANNYPHIKFSLVKESKELTKRFGAVHLYMPQGINVSDSTEYNNVDLGLQGQSILSGTALDDASFKAKSEKLSRDAVSSFGQEGISAALELKSGRAINPYTSLVFTGTGVRSFNFTFPLSPSSEKEANTIKKIVNLFRKFSYPELQGDFALKYPPLFNVVFYNGENVNEYMPKILPSYLTSVSTDYNSSTNAFHDNGSPIETALTLSFTENKNVVRNDLYDVVTNEPL